MQVHVAVQPLASLSPQLSCLLPQAYSLSPCIVLSAVIGSQVDLSNEAKGKW